MRHKSLEFFLFESVNFHAFSYRVNSENWWKCTTLFRFWYDIFLIHNFLTTIPSRVLNGKRSKKAGRGAAQWCLLSSRYRVHITSCYSLQIVLSLSISILSQSQFSHRLYEDSLPHSFIRNTARDESHVTDEACSLRSLLSLSSPVTKCIAVQSTSPSSSSHPCLSLSFLALSGEWSQQFFHCQ